MRNKMQGCKKTYKIHIKNQSTTHIYITIVVILVGHEIKKIFDFRFSIFESVYLDFRPTLSRLAFVSHNFATKRIFKEFFDETFN